MFHHHLVISAQEDEFRGSPGVGYVNSACRSSGRTPSTPAYHPRHHLGNVAAGVDNDIRPPQFRDKPFVIRRDELVEHASLSIGPLLCSVLGDGHEIGLNQFGDLFMTSAPIRLNGRRFDDTAPAGHRSCKMPLDTSVRGNQKQPSTVYQTAKSPLSCAVFICAKWSLYLVTASSGKRNGFIRS